MQEGRAAAVTLCPLPRRESSAVGGHSTSPALVPTLLPVSAEPVDGEAISSLLIETTVVAPSMQRLLAGCRTAQQGNLVIPYISEFVLGSFTWVR
jgi:hypothetical protein